MKPSSDHLTISHSHRTHGHSRSHTETCGTYSIGLCDECLWKFATIARGHDRTTQWETDKRESKMWCPRSRPSNAGTCGSCCCVGGYDAMAQTAPFTEPYPNGLIRRPGLAEGDALRKMAVKPRLLVRTRWTLTGTDARHRDANAENKWAEKDTHRWQNTWNAHQHK